MKNNFMIYVSQEILVLIITTIGLFLIIKLFPKLIWSFEDKDFTTQCNQVMDEIVEEAAKNKKYGK